MEKEVVVILGSSLLGSVRMAQSVYYILGLLETRSKIS